MGDDFSFPGPIDRSTINVKPQVTLYLLADAVRAPINGEQLAVAEAQFRTLPRDTVPEVAPLPAGSRIAFAHNPLFVGRAADLRGIANAFRAGETVGIGGLAAATGIGGIGKTQLAAEFAHRYGQFFAGGVFWLSFADPASIGTEVAACGSAELTGRPDYATLSISEQVKVVLAIWLSPLPRLLIFDNCEDESLLSHWRPPSGGCRVLVTSRRHTWSAGLGVRPWPLGVLARAESIALLRKHRPDLDDAYAEAIAHELGDLPLALHLAGCFLALYRNDSFAAPAAYLSALRRPDLLNHPSLTSGDFSPTEHDQHVGRTFALSYERLRPDNAGDAMALDLLARAACFAPGEPIPRDVLLATLAPAEDAPEAKRRASEALRRLVDLGLVELQESGTPVLHRLVARFVQNTVKDRLVAAHDAVEQTVTTNAARLNAAGFPAPLLIWQLHLRHVADQAAARNSITAGRLFNELGYHLRAVADFRGARAAYERALAIHEKTFGPNHPITARSVNNLGGVLMGLGDFAGARAAFERALAIDQAALASDDPEVALVMNNLGAALQELGDLTGARAAIEGAIAIDEKVSGPNDINLASHINNLGGVLRDLGDLAGARAAFERAMTINEAAFGSEHPLVGTTVNNVGGVLQELGDLPGARAAYERALTIDEKAFGADHPEVATDMNNIGRVLHDLGDFDGARAAFERSLAINERAFGPHHVSVARTLNNLGGVLKDVGDLVGARASFERALAIDEKALGPDHPEVAMVLNNLGTVHQALNDLAGARAAIERAVAITETAFGPNHPRVARLLNNLAGALQAIGDFNGARAALERALTIQEKAGAPDNPGIAMLLNNLAGLLQAVGDLSGARVALERALTIQEKASGPDDRRVGMLVNNLGGVLQAIGDLPHARAAFERALALEEKALGRDHPAVVGRISNLGSVLYDLGDIAGARAAFERAAAVATKALGSDHPLTVKLVGSIRARFPASSSRADGRP